MCRSGCSDLSVQFSRLQAQAAGCSSVAASRGQGDVHFPEKLGPRGPRVSGVSHSTPAILLGRSDACNDDEAVLVVACHGKSSELPQ